MAEGRVCVIGIWHLGLVTSVCLADFGYSVIGVDPDRERVTALNQGKAPLFEPGAEELLARGLASGRLRYTTDLVTAAQEADYLWITYDTPIDDQDVADLTPILTAVQELEAAKAVRPTALVLVSSQVPVGTCSRIQQILWPGEQRRRASLAYLPENLRLGEAIQRFRHPDMIVAGAADEATHTRVKAFLAPIAAPVLEMDLPAAEMTKHAINTYLATCISFANELAKLCERVGADAIKVVQALKMDRRVSPHAPLLPGLGFAGGTLARDLKVLRGLGDQLGVDTQLLDGVLTVNQQQNTFVPRRLKEIYPSLGGRRIGVLGLTYKAGTSTLRRSAAVETIHALEAEGAKVQAYDPKADLSELSEPQRWTICPDPYAVAARSDGLVVMVPWPEFLSLDFRRVHALMAEPVIVDPQNCLDMNALMGMGFTYLGVGRGVPRLPAKGLA